MLASVARTAACRAVAQLSRFRQPCTRISCAADVWKLLSTFSVTDAREHAPGSFEHAAQSTTKLKALRPSSIGFQRRPGSLMGAWTVHAGLVIFVSCKPDRQPALRRIAAHRTAVPRVPSRRPRCCARELQQRALHLFPQYHPAADVPNVRRVMPCARWSSAHESMGWKDLPRRRAPPPGRH